jgi:hypothetical protein
MNNNTITPQEKAEKIFAEIVRIAKNGGNEEERKAKLEKGKMAAIAMLDAQIDYALQCRAEFENIIKLSKK